MVLTSPQTFAFSPTNTPAPHTPLAQAAFMDPPREHFNARLPSILPIVIEPLLIDTLAHDFKVEATYRANMHAFVDVRFLLSPARTSKLITSFRLLSQMANWANLISSPAYISSQQAMQTSRNAAASPPIKVLLTSKASTAT